MNRKYDVAAYVWPAFTGDEPRTRIFWPDGIGEWQTVKSGPRSEEEAYREYFESIVENILSFSDFDVYGHLDYVVRYGPNADKEYFYAKYQDILDKILRLSFKNDAFTCIAELSPFGKGQSENRQEPSVSKLSLTDRNTSASLTIGKRKEKRS